MLGPSFEEHPNSVWWPKKIKGIVFFVVVSVFFPHNVPVHIPKHPWESVTTNLGILAGRTRRRRESEQNTWFHHPKKKQGRCFYNEISSDYLQTRKKWPPWHQTAPPPQPERSNAQTSRQTKERTTTENRWSAFDNEHSRIGPPTRRRFRFSCNFYKTSAAYRTSDL